MTLEEKRIKELVKLMDELAEAGRDQDAALIEWAVFELERHFNLTIK